MACDDVPGLEDIMSSCSEETLALNDSSSTAFDFDDVNLCEKVDLLATTLGRKPPSMPLREEMISLGIECVFKAKGVGWNGVKKISKMERRKNNRKITNKRTILKCVTDCSPLQLHDDTTPKNNNTTTRFEQKGRLDEKGLLALSYEQYLEYLRRCNSKTKESFEHPYLELEWSNENGLKKRIFTSKLKGSEETYYNIFETGTEVEVIDYPSELPVIDDQSATTDKAEVITDTVHKVGTGEGQPLRRSALIAPGPDLVEKNGGDMESSMNLAKDVSLSDEAVGRTKDSSDSFVAEMMSSGSKLMERNNMKCITQDTTTVATSTRTLHAESQQVFKPKREPKALQFARASSIMDSVANSGRLISEEVLSSSPKTSQQNNESRGIDEENEDDESSDELSHESRDETRIRPKAKDLRDGAEHSIFRNVAATTFPQALTVPRVHRFSYYDPSNFEEVRPEEQSEEEPEEGPEALSEVLSEVLSEDQPDEKSGPLSPHSSHFLSASSVLSNSSTIGDSPDKKSEDKSQLAVIGQDFEYQIPMNLSYDSCHSSLYSKDQVGVKTPREDDMNSNPSFGLGDLIQQSFSLSSFQSARTNMSKKSAKSILSAEDVEYCVAYTVSELDRINSLLTEADIEATADSLSCTSESTSGRDILYFARQSKNEIAALQNLIEQHINLEKESGSFDVTPSVVSSRDIDQSNSFGTMTSMKSRMSLLESPSMDRLINEVNNLCTQIEDRIENIVNDTGGGTK